MNILFIVKSFSIGGVEIVTTALANKFVKEGHKVTVFSMIPTDNNITYKLSPNINYYEGVGFNNSNETIKRLRDVYIREGTNIVINQWGLPFVPIRPAKKAARGLQIKFISVYHNDPMTNGRIQNVKLSLELTNNLLLRILLHVKLSLFKLVTSTSMSYVYRKSDCFMVLSSSYIENFKSFTGISNPKKLVVQTNPITIDVSNAEQSLIKKTKEILYVGRLDYTQKRVYRILETWKRLEKTFPEWRLTLLGDGPEKETLERLQFELNLHNVFFEGVQDPILYYKRATILVLTSDFEGFPLVLAEGMSYGVVPIVYGSFPSIYDIINDGVDGIIVPKVNGCFSSNLMAEKINAVLTDYNMLNQMAKAAIKKSMYYSMDSIYQQWLKVLNMIDNK